MGTTVADVIRSMSDLELAGFLTEIISERDQIMSDRLAEQGVPHGLIEMPQISIAYNLAFLRRPAEEVFYLDEMGEEE